MQFEQRSPIRAWAKARSELASVFVKMLGHPFDGHPLVHWTKVQSELAYILIQNVKGVANEPLAIEGVTNEPPTPRL